MSNDQPEKRSKKLLRSLCEVVKTPLHFKSFPVGDESEFPSAFNNNQYQLRLMRYTEHLKHLLDNPPVFNPDGCDELHHEKLDNYLWVVGEMISGIYEMNRGSKPDSE